MRNLLNLLLILSSTTVAFGQSILIDPNTGNSGNININSTNGGIVIPRMTSTQISAITNPVQGLMVFQTDGVTGFYVNKSSIPAVPNWVRISEGDNFWTKNIFSVNDIYSINSGNIGVGISSPTSKFEISANGTTAAIRTSQTGTSGNAGLFTISNSANTSSAILTQTNGSGTTIAANNTGTGKVAAFTNTSSGNTQDAVSITNVGSGDALYVYSSGSGAGEILETNNASNTNPVLSATHFGLGKGGYFEINNSSNNTYAIHAKTNGTESAGVFEVTNASSVRPAIYGGTTGSGMGVFGSSATGAGGYFTATSGLALRTGTGNVAIGAATAPDKLTVTTTSSNYGITHTDGTVSIGTYVNNIAGWLGTKSNHPIFFYTNSGSSQMALSTSGLFGVGTMTPTKAGLVVDKKVGATNAIFGENTTGVSIESSYPGIGFNGYYNAARRAIVDGYVSGFSLNPTTGLLVYYNTLTSQLASVTSISTVDRFVIDRFGKVGIGLTNPDQLLDVNGRMRIRSGVNTSGIWMSNSTNGLTTADGSFFGQKTDTQAGIYIGDNWRFWVDNTGVVNAPNKLQVGTTAIPTGYKMSVDGKMLCTELEVLVTPWPDYVFRPSYKLKPLQEVEQFIDENGHLPNIPKAEEIESKSLAVGNMSRLQMEKIEELTLYLIEINKKLKHLEDENAQLKNEINKLKK